MKWSTNKNLLAVLSSRHRAFSLVETTTALIILAIISSSVLVVVNRSMASTADSTSRMQAFEVARENMEILLTKDSVAEMAEYGASDKYPEIQWTTITEMFYESLTERMWLKAVCSAEYTDTQGQTQNIEFTHWLTDITKEQLIEMLQQKLGDLTDEDILETLEQAMEYAGVTEETIMQWIENGMLVTEEEYYIKNELDLYNETGGKPTEQDRIERLNRAISEAESAVEPSDEGQAKSSDKSDSSLETTETPEDIDNTDDTDAQPKSDDELMCGYTKEELMALPISKIFGVLNSCE
ncbi:MAG: type II secretion system protein [Planctomycetes bacterium]|nr:type II secretion system protein [Planctomycetota bacterium]